MEQSRRQSSDVKISKQWSCDRCPSKFGRLDHLKRHELTHKTGKSNVCLFCRASFSRGDVLRRHWKSCKARVDNGYSIPEPHQGGKQRRACDSCASLRKACNGEQPCSECCYRDRQCSYQRLCETPGNPPSSLQGGSQQVLEADADIDPMSESTWDLGLQTFYPSASAHAHRNLHNLSTF